MILPGKVLAFLRRLFASLIWFAAAPKDWDPDQDFEVKMKDGYLVQRRRDNSEMKLKTTRKSGDFDRAGMM